LIADTPSLASDGEERRVVLHDDEPPAVHRDARRRADVRGTIVVRGGVARVGQGTRREDANAEAGIELCASHQS